MRMAAARISTAAFGFAMATGLGGCNGSSDSANLPFSGPEILTHTTSPPTSVVFGDFNGDGRTDIVATIDGKAYFLAGNNDGSFQTPKALSALQAYVGNFTVVDVNRDGKLDLSVVGCRTAGCTASDSHLFVLLGSGDGTFRVSFEERGIGVPGIGDFDDDGNPDLAVVEWSGQVTILRGHGDGTFESLSGGAPQFQFLSVAVADLTGDGRPDLVAHQYGPGIRVLVGHGDGTFGAPSSPNCLFPVRVEFADFNGDSKVDVVLSCEFRGPGVGDHLYLKLLPGNGDGTFGPSSDPLGPSSDPFGIGKHMLTFAAGDVDRDGKHDLVVQTEDTPELLILAGNGDGTFATVQQRASDPGQSIQGLVDMNGDGYPDLVLTDGNGIVVLLNTSPGAKP